jgi:hypothetical protein
MGEHVFAQGGIDAALIFLAGGFEEGEDFGVEAQSDLLLVFFRDEVGDAPPAHAVLGRNIGIVNRCQASSSSVEISGGLSGSRRKKTIPVESLLMSICLSGGDQANALFSPSKYDYQDCEVYSAPNNPSFFVIFVSRIQVLLSHRIVEYLACSRERDAVLAQV